MTNAQSISNQILEAFDLYQEMLSNDQKLRQLISDRDKSRNSILKGIAGAGASGSVDANCVGNKNINSNLDRLDRQYEKIEEERIKYLQSKLTWLHEYYQPIFELITGETPPTRSLLRNVLNAYLELNQGKQNEITILKKNMENLRRQNGLPDDFFDWDAYQKSQAQFR